MAQNGYTPILIYSSSTTTNAPSAGNLTNSTLGSELAINITDGKLFYKDNANAVQVIAWKTTPTTAGGTGLTSYTAGDLLYYASGTTLSKLAIGTSGQWLGSSGTAPQWNLPSALTKTDDTNVTLTLGGSASTALLNAASLTLGWTGQLATTRGGTGLSSFTNQGILYASSTSALTTGSALTFDGSSLSVSSASSLMATFNSTTNNPYIRFNQSGTSKFYIGESSAVGGGAGYYDLYAVTGLGIRFFANAGVKATIFSSGGFSIGNTTDPGASNLSVTGSISVSQTAGIIGTTTNNDANAGSVGEYVSSTIASGSGTSLTVSGTVYNVTSISLTAGDWDVSGIVNYTSSTGTETYTYVQSGTSTTSATLGANGSIIGGSYGGAKLTAVVDWGMVVPTFRYSLSGTTTVYLVARASYSGTTPSAYGAIRARRVR